MANEQNRTHWNRSGETWVTHQQTFDLMLAPIGELLVDAVDPRPGERTLDVGSGFGTTSLALADRGAVVHGVDISDPMVVAARVRVPAATFDVADAQTEPLGGPYDSVVSRFGVMFFDDPLTAFTNIGHHTSPSGRLTFTCWNDKDRSSAVWAGTDVILGALPDPPPAAPIGAPGPFGLADRDHTDEVLRAAGWTDVSIVGHDIACPIGWPHSDGVEERLAVALASEPGRLLREQVAVADQPAIISAVRASLAERVHDGALRLDASIWLVTATHP
jgi:SAM-dependent methyltransferase